MVFFCRATYYCFDLRIPLCSEKKVACLSVCMDATDQDLSDYTRSVLKQATKTHEGSDCYKLVNTLGNEGVYFYEFKNSVACGKVYLEENVLVTTIDSILGMNGAAISSVSPPYNPCLSVVASHEYEQQQRQLSEQQRQLSLLLGFLEQNQLEGALILCKSFINNPSPSITAPSTIPNIHMDANELVINNHFKAWLSLVTPKNVFIEVNTQSTTKFSVFSSSKTDFSLISDSRKNQKAFIRIEHGQHCSGAAIECEMDNTSSHENQMIAEMHKVASEVGHRLVKSDGVLFKHLTVYGLLVLFKRSDEAVLYKLDLDFTEGCVCISKSGRTCTTTEGVSYLVAVLTACY